MNVKSYIKYLILLLSFFIIMFGLSTLLSPSHAAKERSGTYEGVDWHISTDGVLTIGKEGETQTFDDSNNRGPAVSATSNSFPWYSNYDVVSVKFAGTVIAQGSLSAMFFDMQNIKSIDFTNFDTSAATRMDLMFYNCPVTELDLSMFDTSNVTSMSQMFSGTVKLEKLDLSSFTTEKVTNMSSMFSASSVEELDISNFDTSGITNYQSLFGRENGLRKLTIGEKTDLSKFGDTFGRWSKTNSIDDTIVGFSSINSPGTWYKIDICNSQYKMSGEYEGVCWEINEDGQLAIGKDGETQTFSEQTYHFFPWTYWDYSNNIKSVVFKGTVIGQGSISRMFDGLSYVTNIDLTNFDTSNVTNMSYMFSDCSNLTSINLSSMDTANVENMSGMFSYSSKITDLDLSSFNTSNVTDMSYMFNTCTNLNTINLSSFNTSKVTTMRSMFSGCSNLSEIDLSGFNTPHVTDMSYMFSSCKNVKKLDLTGFNTSNVSDMYSVFYNMTSLSELTIGDKTDFSSYSENSSDKKTWSKTKRLSDSVFGISNINSAGTWYTVEPCKKTYDGVCYEIKDGTLIIGREGDTQTFTDNSRRSLNSYPWNNARPSINSVKIVGEVIGQGNMNYLFADLYNATSIDLTGFDTTNITNMQGMFRSASEVTELDLSMFNTENVTNMSNMFEGSISLKNLDISNFNTSKVSSMNSMFNNVNSLESIIIGNNTNLSKSQHSQDKWSKTNDINDSVVGLKNINSSGTWNKIKEAEQPKNGIYDGVWWEITDAGELIIGKEGETHTFDNNNYRYVSNYPWQKYKDDVTSVSFKGNVIGQGSMAHMFYQFDRVTKIDLTGFDTTNVTNMTGMFSMCYILSDLNISNMNTSNVTDMSFMFNECYALEHLDLSHFDTSKVVDMYRMFGICKNLITLDISSFDTSKVDSMISMFMSTDALTELHIGEKTNLADSYHNEHNWSKTRNINESVEGISNIDSAGTWYLTLDSANATCDYYIDEEHDSDMYSLKNGDYILFGGMYGKVNYIDDNIIMINNDIGSYLNNILSISSKTDEHNINTFSIQKKGNFKIYNADGTEVEDLKWLIYRLLYNESQEVTYDGVTYPYEKYDDYADFKISLRRSDLTRATVPGYYIEFFSNSSNGSNNFYTGTRYNLSLSTTQYKETITFSIYAAGSLENKSATICKRKKAKGMYTLAIQKREEGSGNHPNPKDPGYYDGIDFQDLPVGYTKSLTSLVEAYYDNNTGERIGYKYYYGGENQDFYDIKYIRNEGEKVISSVKYSLTGNNYNQEILTDYQGEAIFKDLEPGEYTLKEISGPEGVEISEEEYKVIVSDDGSVIIDNYEQKGIEKNAAFYNFYNKWNYPYRYVNITKKWEGIDENTQLFTPEITCVVSETREANIVYNGVGGTKYISGQGVNKDNEWTINDDGTWTYQMNIGSWKNSPYNVCWESNLGVAWESNYGPIPNSAWGDQYAATGNNITFINRYSIEKLNESKGDVGFFKFDAFTNKPIRGVVFHLTGTDYWGKEYDMYSVSDDSGHAYFTGLRVTLDGYKIEEETPDGYIGKQYVVMFYPLRYLDSSYEYYPQLIPRIYDHYGNDVNDDMRNVIYNYPSTNIQLRKMSADIKEGPLTIDQILTGTNKTVPTLSISEGIYSDGRNYNNADSVSDVSFTLKGKRIDNVEVEETYITNSSGYFTIDNVYPGDYELIENTDRNDIIPTTYVLIIDDKYKVHISEKGSVNYEKASHDEENDVYYLWNQTKEHEYDPVEEDPKPPVDTPKEDLNLVKGARATTPLTLDKIVIYSELAIISILVIGIMTLLIKRRF